MICMAIILIIIRLTYQCRKLLKSWWGADPSIPRKKRWSAGSASTSTSKPTKSPSLSPMIRKIWRPSPSTTSTASTPDRAKSMKKQPLILFRPSSKATMAPCSPTDRLAVARPSPCSAILQATNTKASFPEPSVTSWVSSTPPSPIKNISCVAPTWKYTMKKSMTC